MTEDASRYPVGTYEPPHPISDAQVARWIEEIEAFPATLRLLVSELDDRVLDTRYRKNGWTLRQVVHHLADSHLNSMIRFKWTLTETEPTIKAYFEDRWAELPDYELPIEPSLAFLEALHARWAVFLRTLSAQDLDRKFHHPETDALFTLRTTVGQYAWHGRHHLAHIRMGIERSSRPDDVKES